MGEIISDQTGIWTRGDPLNLDMLYQQSLISGAGIPNLIKISRSDSYLFWEQ